MLHDRSCFALIALLSLLFALAGSAARAVTVEQIPTPRPEGWAVDMTHTLSTERLAELNRLGEDVKTKANTELAVVVVPSTDGVDSHEFATRLFNAWGIGSQTSNNGILVFAALNDHKAEIVLGNGLDTEAGRRESQTVMQQEMIPRFRNGDPTGAVVLGALACARRLLGVSPLVEGVETPPGMAATPAPAPPAEGTNSYTDSGGIVHPIAPPTPYPSQIPVSYENPADSEAKRELAWLLGLIATFGGIAGYVATRKPRCPKCKQKMVMLDEQADDAYLQPAEKVEERIGSINYEIWSCPTCGELKKRRGAAFFSRYTACPECGAKTLSSESTTLREATYSHGGEIQVDQTCANCSYRNRYIRYTAQLVRQEERSYSSSSSSASSHSLFSSSSGSSSSSFSSSSGSSSSGSSSSSGFSGGSSSGGGASGSW